MTTGLRAGVVDADHVYTLMTTQTRAINAQLEQMVTTMDETAERTDANDSGGHIIRGR